MLVDGPLYQLEVVQRPIDTLTTATLTGAGQDRPGAMSQTVLVRQLSRLSSPIAVGRLQVHPGQRGPVRLGPLQTARHPGGGRLHRDPPHLRGQAPADLGPAYAHGAV